MNTYSQKILEAKNTLGGFARLGAVCGVSGNAIMKWLANGKPPRTEYTGETNYADEIIAAVDGRIQIDRASLIPPIRQSANDS